jgi:SAM-dependent methyltransferase
MAKVLTKCSTPNNIHFEIRDAEDDWQFPQQFDYIHGRAILSCFKDPFSVIQQAYNSLSPGGYLELQDGIFPFKYVGDVPTDSALYKWNEIATAGAAKSGRPWTNCQRYKRWMEEIGFEDVVEKKFYWPTSAWAKGAYYKTVGAWWQTDLLQGLEAISLKVFGLMGYDADKTRAFLEDVRKDVKNTDIHAYLSM